MLPKRKKTGDAPGVKVPAWHLDFRNSDRLPDVKPIRTAFFVNGFAILVAAAVALNFAYQEFQLQQVRGEIADWRNRIDADRQPSAAAVAQFRAFQQEEKKVKEAATFLERKLSLSHFLLRLGEILPENIIIDALDWRGAVITLRGTVKGSPDEASGHASTFLRLLNEDEVFGPIFNDAALTSLIRNPTTGLLSLEIRMEIPAK